MMLFAALRSHARTTATRSLRFSMGQERALVFSPQQCRSFAAAKKVVDVRRSEQRAVWSSYLAGSSSPADLFCEIDLNRSNTISVEEITYFIDTVERSGVDAKKFDLLQQLGSDHQLDRKEFEQWLRVATDVNSDGAELTKHESSSSDLPNNESTVTSAPKKKVVDVRHGLQVVVWDYFLSTGTHASDLFKMIDLNRSNKISVVEIAYFIDSIGGKGVDPSKLDGLKALGEDHELGEEEFYEWLSDATGVELNEDGEFEYQHSSVRSDGEGCTPAQWA